MQEADRKTDRNSREIVLVGEDGFKGGGEREGKGYEYTIREKEGYR